MEDPWTIRGRPVASLVTLPWPAELPILSPRWAWEKLKDMEVGSVRGVIRKYDALEGAKIIECLAQHGGMPQLQSHPKEVLEFLESANVIDSKGQLSKFRAEAKRLYTCSERVNSGVLAVRVENAQGLVANNISGTVNSSVSVKIGAQEVFQTKKVPKSINPEWNEMRIVVVHYADDKEQAHLNGSELSISFQVCSHRRTTTRSVVGVSKKIPIGKHMVAQPHAMPSSVAPSQSYMLHKEKSENSTKLPALLKIRRGFERENRVQTLNFGVSMPTEDHEQSLDSVMKKIDQEDEDEHVADQDAEFSRFGRLQARLVFLSQESAVAPEQPPSISDYANAPNSTGAEGNAKGFIKKVIKPINDTGKKVLRMSGSYLKEDGKTPKEVVTTGRDNKSAVPYDVFFRKNLAELTPKHVENTKRAFAKAVSEADVTGISDADRSRAFLFSRPEIVFDFLSKPVLDDPSKRAIFRGTWMILGPLFPPLVTCFDACKVFNGLATMQLGHTGFRNKLRSGSIANIEYETFKQYVLLLKEEYESMSSSFARVLEEFPTIAQELKDETGGCVFDNMRTGDQQNKSSSLKGGKLIVTPKSLHYCRKRIIKKDDIFRLDMVDAATVMVQNGSTSFGFMVGFEGNQPQNSAANMNIPPSVPANNLADIFALADLDEEVGIEETASLNSEGTDDFFHDAAGGSFRASSLFPSKSLNEQDSERLVASSLFPSKSLNEQDSERLVSENQEKGRSQRRPKYDFSVARRAISRYTVFHMSIDSSTRRRDECMVIIRSVIAFSLFCAKVLDMVVAEEVVAFTAQGNGPWPQEKVQLACRQTAREAFLMEMVTAKALMRAGKVNVLVNEIFSIGDRWKWNEDVHAFEMLSAVKIAFQSSKRIKSTKLKRLKQSATAMLVQYARKVIWDTVSANEVQVEWREHDFTATKCNEQFVESTASHVLLLFNYVQSEIVISDAHLKSMGENVNLLKQIFEPLIDIARQAKRDFIAVLQWENTVVTASLAAVTLCLILAGYTQYCAGMAAAWLAFRFYGLNISRKKEGFKKLYLPVKNKKTLMQKYRDVRIKYNKAKKALQQVNIFLLKFRCLLTWENERVSTELFFFLLAVAAILFLAPRMFYELVLWVYIFTKKFRSGRTSRRIKKFIREEWEEVPSTPLWEQESAKNTTAKSTSKRSIIDN